MLVGRDAECGRLDRLLAATREGDSAALVIEGEPGIGKSALLEYARERATGMQVLTARGVESEAELPFAGLSQLLTGVLDQLAAIPAPQRDSLQAGLGLAPGSGGDRFAACAATLSLLAAAAEARPLLVIVDDAHWLDQASADALGFTARRLGAEGIALLVAMREGEPDALDTAGLPVLRLGGLDRLACGALLGDATSPEIVARLWWETGGNPLAVLELSTLLEDPQLAGREPLEGPLRVGPQIERAFRRRVDELTEETRRAVLVAAAHDGPALDEVARALEALGLRAAMLEPAERAGIVTLRGAEVVFRHPLVRSAAYHGAPADERRAAHRALAEGLRADRSLARRAWHLAAATVEPDEAVAADLAAAALDARGRAAHAAAARAFETAARLTPGDESRMERLLEAARDYHTAGRPEPARGLLDTALELAVDPRRRADIQFVRARVELMCGAPTRTRELLVAEAARVEGLDPGRAAEMLLEAAVTSFMTGEPRLALELAVRGTTLARGAGGPVEVMASVVLASARVLCGEPMSMEPVIDLAEELIESDYWSGLGTMVAFVGTLALYTEQTERGYKLLTRVEARLRREGMLSLLPFTLASLSEAQLGRAEWAAASAYAMESVALAEATGQVSELSYSLMRLARVEACQGRADACRAHAARSLEIAASLGVGSMRTMTTAALGLLELGLGRLDVAIEWLEPAGRFSLERGLGEPSVAPWAADLAEAQARSGLVEDAERTLAVLEEQGRRLTRIGALAAVARCRGLLAAEEGFEACFRTALDWHARMERPFERARTELCFGERLRRARRRAEAREHLRGALATFEQLGAAPWAERARLELRASGETARPRGEPSAAQHLTERELQVALVVAEGATTREAAATLFLSAKTVEFHLRNIFRKLGVRSRTELSRRMSGEMAELHLPARR